MKGRIASLRLLVMLILGAAWLGRRAVPAGAAAHLPSVRTTWLLGLRPLVSELMWLHIYQRADRGDLGGVLAEIELMLELQPDSETTRNYLAAHVALCRVRVRKLAHRLTFQNSDKRKKLWSIPRLFPRGIRKRRFFSEDP